MVMYWNLCVVVALALCSQVIAQKREKPLLGGWRNVDENDEYAQRALQFATEEFNKASKDGFITEVTRIIRMKKQVVAGMKYSMEVEARVSPCSNNKHATEECQNQKTVKKTCSFVVVDVPWENYKNLESSHCRTKKN